MTRAPEPFPRTRPRCRAQASSYHGGAMALPKQISLVTFDVYGTLIDWEQGVYDAFQKEAARDGFTIDREELIRNFHVIEREIEGGSYELYAEVLRRTAIEISKRLDWPLEPS